MSTKPTDRIPARTLLIVGNEACERFSYYGMSGILTLYMIRTLHFEEHQAASYSGLFKAGVYFMPLLGALIADRWLGRYMTIVSLSFFYCLGHLALALTEGSESGLILGLALIALGAGGIKPCVSAFMGDQLKGERGPIVSRAYSLFYWSINFGSFFALALIPWVRLHWGYSWAFGIPGIAMAVAWALFMLGTPWYVRVPPSGKKPGFFSVVSHCLKRRGDGSFWKPAREKFGDELTDGCRRVLGVLGLLSVTPVFWALYEQTNTTWIYQGVKLTPVIFQAPMIGEWRLDGESIQSINAALVMIMLPAFTFGAYPLATKLGINPSPLRRMTLGCAIVASAFIACALVQTRVDAGISTSILWQVPAYLLLTAGEILFSTTGLEFAFTQAPIMMRSTLMSFWLLSMSLGNLLFAGFTELGKGRSLLFGFVFYAALIAVVTVVFGLLARRYARTHEV